MNFSTKVELCGRFQLVVRKAATGEQCRESAWTDNIVLNTGLNRMSVGDWITQCCVGSGNSLPAITQTKLDNIIAATTSINASSKGRNFTNAPLYSWVRRTWIFGEGQAEGNISEVGMGWQEGAGLQNHQLWNRALIKDLVGNPTTITVFNDEYLEVISEIRMHFKQTFTGAFNMVDKYGAVLSSYTYSGIPYMAEGQQAFYPVYISRLGIYSNFKQDLVTLPNNLIYSSDNSGAFVPVNTYPTARSVQAKCKVPLGLGNDAVHRTLVVWFAGMLSNPEGYSAYQVEITPPITKTSNDILEYTFTLTWDRFIP